MHARTICKEKFDNCSDSTFERIVKNDPLFPAGFPLNGGFARYWLEEDIDAYLALKAKRAQDAKAIEHMARVHSEAAATRGRLEHGAPVKPSKDPKTESSIVSD
jgi:hypothetical protein